MTSSSDGSSGAPTRWAAAAAVLHLLVSAYHYLRGVSIRHDFPPSTWDFFWQNLTTADLKDRALESLWYLHAQPPLWNALNAPLIKLFGDAQPEALQIVHVLLGAALAALAVRVAAGLTGSLLAGAVAGALVALDPALVLYEAFPLYEVLCAFLVMLTLWAVVRAGPEGKTRPLAVALAALGALVLTRSLYHVAIMIPAVAAAMLARNRRAVLAIGLAATLLPAGWYAKNLAQNGFFGGSSWYGMGLWRVTLFRYRNAELAPMAISGELDPIVSAPPFSTPSRYRPLGYDRVSDIPSMSRNDFHNVNIPAVSTAFGRSARTLIAHDPLHFLGNIVIGYGNFSAPSTEYEQLAPDRERMATHVAAWRVLTGLPIARLVDRSLPIGTSGSFFLVLIPLGLVTHAWLLARRWKGGESIEATLRTDAPLLWAAGLIVYTTLVGSALELGENLRFKFMIEPLLLTYWAILTVRWWRVRRTL